MNHALHLAALTIFWAAAFCILYTYFFYPVLLMVLFSFAQVRRDIAYLLGRFDRRARKPEVDWPSVSIIMAAFNEEDRLPAKLTNLKDIVYPEVKIEIIVVSDGSTDMTNDILLKAADPRIKTILLNERGGKPNAINQGVAAARGEILVFCDAATLFRDDTVEMLVRHFSNPKVGVVCGSLRFEGSEESNQTEGVYWKYETVLRMMESRLGATLTASGALYAIRSSAYSPVAANTVIEDFIIPMNARKLGFSVVYDPEAVGIEFAASTVSGEFTRRVRLAVGSFRSLGQLITTPVDFYTALALFSHKVMRWFVFLFAGLLILSNLALLSNLLYQATFLLQVGFYLAALCGYLLRERPHKLRVAKLGYFLVAMNWAFVVGLFRCLSGRDSVKWQRVA